MPDLPVIIPTYSCSDQPCISQIIMHFKAMFVFVFYSDRCFAVGERYSVVLKADSERVTVIRIQSVKNIKRSMSCLF